MQITARGRAHDFTVVGVSRFGSVKSLGVATAAVFDLETAKSLFERGDQVDGILVAGTASHDAIAAAVPSATVTTAAAQDRFTLDGLEQFISIIRIALLVFGGVAILVGAFTIFNTLSITVAQRTRELGLLRMVGGFRRQVLGSVLVEALVIGIGASVVGLFAGLGLAKALDALFDAMKLSLPEAGTVFAAPDDRRVAAAGHARDAAGRPAAGVAGDAGRPRRGAARHGAGLRPRPAPRPRRPGAGRPRRPPGAGVRRLARARSRAATRCASRAARSAPPRR